MKTRVAAEVKSRSGTKWGEAEYSAAGYGRLHLRVAQSTLDALSRLAKRTGESRAAVLDRLILVAEKKK